MTTKKKLQIDESEELYALTKLSQIIGALEDFDDALNQIVTTVASVTSVDICSIYLLNEDKQKLVLRASKGLSKRALGKVRLQVGKGALGKAASEKKILAVKDVKNDPQYQHIPGIETVKTQSSAAVPLISHGQLLGVLDIQTFSPHNFTKKEKGLLTKLGGEIAILISGAQLFDSTKKALMEHRVLYQIGLLLTSAEKVEEVLNVIVQSAVRLVETPAGSLALYDPESGEFYLTVAVGFSPSFSKVRRWSLRKDGLTSMIVSQGTPVVISDVSREPHFDNPVMLNEGIKSLVAAPLVAEGRIVGILYVDDFVPREFNSTEVSILSLLASQATIAIMKAQLLERTKQLAITDGLTDIFNHRYFQERLIEEMMRAERYKRNLSLILLDIDYFKLYNDTYGHPKGDIILKRIAGILENATREVDIVARYGGEEFVAILPETGKEDALKVANKICTAVEDYHFPNEDTQPEGKITVSLGVATHPEDSMTREKLIDIADRAMYLAKGSGKNKVCTIDSSK